MLTVLVFIYCAAFVFFFIDIVEFADEMDKEAGIAKDPGNYLLALTMAAIWPTWFPVWLYYRLVGDKE